MRYKIVTWYCEEIVIDFVNFSRHTAKHLFRSPAPEYSQWLAI